MTLGYWIDEARTALHTTATAMDGQAPGGSGEILTVVGARNDIYTGLMRLTASLIGGQPTRQRTGRAAADLVLDRTGQHLTRLYVGLHAALVEQQYPPALAPSSPAGAGLRHAADAIGLAGDILASHLPPGAQPRTPEGAAILAGGGVQAALADVARLTHDVVGVDAKLPAWLAQGDDLYAGTYQPVAEAARWASGSRLRVVARELIATGSNHPPLLRLLGHAPPLPETNPRVITGDDAITAITAARDWMWRHPDQVRVEHLQAATQLGLTMHTLTPTFPKESLRAWRKAAMAAADLRGSPTIGEARHAHTELAGALRWAREQLRSSRQEPTDFLVADISRLVDALPVLAVALHRAVPQAVSRGELFVREQPSLQKTKLLYYATANWRSATAEDDPVRRLKSALTQLKSGEAADALRPLVTRTSIASLAFSAPTRPRNEPVTSRPPAPRSGQPTARDMERD